MVDTVRPYVNTPSIMCWQIIQMVTILYADVEQIPGDVREDKGRFFIA